MARANKGLLVTLGLGAGVAGIAALAGGAKAKAKAPPAEGPDAEPTPPRRVAPPGPPVSVPEPEEIDEDVTQEELDDLADAVDQEEDDDEPEDEDDEDDEPEPDEPDVTDEELDDLADAVDLEEDDDAEDDEGDDQVTLSDTQRAYLAALRQSIRGSQTLSDQQMGQLEAMLREVLLGVDGGPAVLSALQAAGHPPTAATWCRLMGGSLEGLRPPLSPASIRNRYPSIRGVIETVCATPAPEPEPEEREAVVTVDSPRRAPPTPVESEPGTAEPTGPQPPAGYNPVSAGRLSKQVARNIDAKACAGYSRQLLRQFQRAAGLEVDGLYGGGSRGALIHFGVRRPPQPCVATRGSRETRPYKWADMEG